MKISLKRLILIVALLAVALTFITTLISASRVNKDVLVTNTLETNRVYAEKLAITTNQYMESTLQTLAYSANDIARYLKEDNAAELLSNESERLFSQTNTFNTVVISSAEGEIIGASPESANLVGQLVTAPGGLQALKERKPLITKPYTSITNNLIIFISSPIFDSNGTYLGYVGGSIYLQEKNVLNDLLGEHFYKDGSYVYIADEDGRLLYHPNIERIGEYVTQNAVISQIMNGKSGAAKVTNSKDIEMLSGFGYMPTTKWGIVSQRPVKAALAPSEDLRHQILFRTVPFLLLFFILILIIAHKIAKPLCKLAYYANASTKNKELEEISDINAWYYEAIELENALVKSFAFFQDKVNFFIHESATDPLTGLVNRRTMDQKTKKWLNDGVPFALVIFDIDKFKRVNDRYGHSVGDDVLKFLAKEMLAVSRDEDVCCRYGGEEFVLLLPYTTTLEAFEVAERLRKKLETTISPCGEVITISSGISSFPETGHHMVELIEAADECLYEAKNTGRNKTIMAKNKVIPEIPLKN